jgi:hypothetical protein
MQIINNAFRHIALLILLGILSSPELHAQTFRSDLPLLVKLVLFQESSGTRMYQMNEDALDTFLQLEFQADTLEQSGFDDFIFLGINPVYKNPNRVSLEEGPFLPSNCGIYVVAIHRNGKVVYRLKGFANNDFSAFRKSLAVLGYEKVNSPKEFSRNYSVSGVDLKCLYSSSSKYTTDVKSFPCLRDCGDFSPPYGSNKSK